MLGVLKSSPKYLKIILKVNHMRYLQVEEARKKLGHLIDEVREEGPVTIGRRGKEQAVLLSSKDYVRLRQAEENAARARFAAALEAIGSEVRRRKVSERVVEEAIRAARRR